MNETEERWDEYLYKRISSMNAYVVYLKQQGSKKEKQQIEEYQDVIVDLVNQVADEKGIIGYVDCYDEIADNKEFMDWYNTMGEKISKHPGLYDSQDQ